MIVGLFITVLFTFIIGQLFRIQFGNGLVVQGTDVAVFVFVCAWILREVYFKRFASHFQHPYSKPIALFIGIGFLSLLINSTWLTWSQVFVSSLYLFRWIMYAFVFFVVKSFSPEQKKDVIRKLIFMMTVITALGYLQYMFYPNLRNLYYLGWDEHLYRMFSTFLDPNFAAAAFSLFLLLLLGFSFGDKNFVKIRFIQVGVLSVLSFIALLLTYSRGGFLTFTAGIIVLFLLLKKKLYLFGLLTALVIGIILIPKDLRSSGVELWRTASIFARTDAAQQAFRIFTDHPVVGVGFDSYRYAQKHYGFAADKNWEVSHSGGGTDSSLLFVLATTGVAGFGVYMYLWGTVLRRTYKTYRTDKTNKTLALVVLASIGALFVNSFFINSLFYPFILLWMWTLLGVMERSGR